MKIMFLLAGALALTACDNADYVAGNGTNPVSNPATITTKADQVILHSERAFGLAELAYTMVAKAVTIPVKAGAFDRSQLLRIKQINQQATAVLTKGKATADAVEKARLTAELFGLTDKLNAIRGE